MRLRQERQAGRRLFAAQLRYVLALRPHRGTGQVIEDPAHPPAFTPAEAARHSPLDQWQRTVRPDSHGTDLVRYITEVRLGMTYGPDQLVRLIAATDDPIKLKPDSMPGDPLCHSRRLSRQPSSAARPRRSSAQLRSQLLVPGEFRSIILTDLKGEVHVGSAVVTSRWPPRLPRSR